MASPFFIPALMVNGRAPLPTVAQCGACGLYKGCKSPKMKVDGRGGRKILIVGEAPGRNEDDQGRPFVGESGRLLTDTLRRHGVELREDCWVTNAVICRPKDNKLPDPQVVEYCRPNLIATVERLKPELIIPLGFNAVKSLVGWLWKDDVQSIGRWVGWRIPSQKLNAWICPTWHPSFLLRGDNRGPDPSRIHFDAHVARAVECGGRPYTKPPDWKKRVRVVYDHEEAAVVIRAWTDAEFPVAFDYEFSPLKPDNDTSRIYCASLSDGRVTVAFPWHGKAVPAMREFLLSSTPKVAHNLKAEDRYTRKILGCEVNNWHWDSMLAAHYLDNRPGICGLKFLSFAMLGHPPYDEEVEPYRKSATGNDHNKMDRVPVDKLLTYCALDSLLTMKIAKIQMREVKYG